jgi:predicted glycoside hydrolase/deacetylase ChbG (UPF0249 family)
MPGIHLGLHFALTCEWDRPLWGSASSPDDVPHLADERGMLPRSTHELLDRSVPVSEMVHELETQYARLVAAGIQPHYIDDHMGCSWIPGLASAIETFAREKGVVFFQDSIAGVPGGKDSSVAPKFSVASLRERMDQAEPGTYLLVIHPASKDEAFVKLKLADCHPSNLFERELEFLGFRSPAVFHQLTENEVRLISYPEAATQC